MSKTLDMHSRRGYNWGMAFLKAVQVEFSEERNKYVEALIAYKAEAKRYHKARRVTKNSQNPLEQLEWYKAKDRFSLASRLFQQAREEFSRSQALHKLEARGMDITELSLAKLAGIEIPMSLKDMLEETRREAMAASVKPEQRGMEFSEAETIAAMSPEERNEFIKSGKPLEEYLLTKDFTGRTTVFGGSVLEGRDRDEEIVPIVEPDSMLDEASVCKRCGKQYDSSMSTSNDINTYCSKKCEKGE